MQPLANTACAYGFNIPLSTVFQQFTIKSFVCSEAFAGTCHCHLIKPLTFPSKAARKPIFSQPIVMYWQSDLLRIPTNRSHIKRNHHTDSKINTAEHKKDSSWWIFYSRRSLTCLHLTRIGKGYFLLCGDKKVLKKSLFHQCSCGGSIVWLAYLSNLKVPENSNEADDIQGNGTAAGPTVTFLRILLKMIALASLLSLRFRSLYKWNKFADTYFNMTGVWMSVPPISILRDTASTPWRITAFLNILPPD